MVDLQLVFERPYVQAVITSAGRPLYFYTSLYLLVLEAAFALGGFSRHQQCCTVMIRG